MSSVLRHQAINLGLQMRSDGYVKLNDLLQLPKFRQFSKQAVYEVVRDNDKQRFSIMTDANGCEWVRANQGHTITAIDEDQLLTRIQSPSEVPICVHGTYFRSLTPITQDGLRVMKRNHIHFAPGLPGESGVISGMRKSVEVLIYIDVESAMRDGIAFFWSANRVILSSGIDGVLPPRYFAKVIRVSDGADITNMSVTQADPASAAAASKQKVYKPRR
eukprot:c3665_g1_i1.p1 GENE.c3665_g1_i1~~c3665_g1_i1.p1  ORF type:complete len:242 (+),score=36.08 c3665_g1_i1:75-728(+)